MKKHLKYLLFSFSLSIMYICLFSTNAGAKTITDIKANYESEIYVLYDNGDCIMLSQEDRLPQTIYSDIKKIITTDGRKIIFLKEDGTLWEGGIYDSKNNWIEEENPVQIANNVADVFGDYYITMYLTNDGELFSYETSSDGYGRHGQGLVADARMPQKILSNIKKIKINDKNVLAITNDNELYVWGNFGYSISYKQYGNIKEPKKVLENISDAVVACDEDDNNFNLACITTDGRTVKYTGDLTRSWFRYYDFTKDELELIDVDYSEFYDLEEVVLTEYKAKRIDNIEEAVYVILEDNTMVMITEDETGQIVKNIIIENVAEIYNKQKDEKIYILDTNNMLYSALKSDYNNITHVANDVTVFYQKANLYESQCFISDGNKLYSWGHGWLGYSTLFDEQSPITIMENVKDFKSSDNHTIAVTQNNDIYTWGRVNYTFDRDEIKCTPEYITNLGNITNITLNENNVAMSTENNELWICGDNYAYQFCDESLNNISFSAFSSNNISLFTVPADITRLYEFTKMNYTAKTSDAKNMYMTYIDEEDVLHICGYNYNLGLDTAPIGSSLIDVNNAHNPIKIDENISCVSLESKYYVYSDFDGNVYTFGDLSDLGFNSSVEKRLLFQSDNKIKEVKACTNAIYVLFTDGTLQKLTAVGNETIETEVNFFDAASGRIAVVKNDNTAWIDSPDNVYTNIKKIAVEDDYTLLLDTTGILTGYGSRQYAQLGNGDYNYSDTPKEVKLSYDINNPIISINIENDTDNSKKQIVIEFTYNIDEDVLCSIRQSDAEGDFESVKQYKCQTNNNILTVEIDCDPVSRKVYDLMIWTEKMEPLIKIVNDILVK